MSATLIRGQQKDLYFKQLKEDLQKIDKWYVPVTDSIDNVHILWNAVEVAQLGKVMPWHKGEIPYGIEFKSNFLYIETATQLADILLKYAKKVAKLHDQKK